MEEIKEVNRKEDLDKPTDEWTITFYETKSSEFPTRKLKVSFDPGRYDEAALACYHHGASAPNRLERVQSVLTEYRQAPIQRKIEMLEPVVEEQRLNVNYIKGFVELAESAIATAENEEIRARNEAFRKERQETLEVLTLIHEQTLGILDIMKEGISSEANIHDRTLEMLSNMKGSVLPAANREGGYLRYYSSKLLNCLLAELDGEFYPPNSEEPWPWKRFGSGKTNGMLTIKPREKELQKPEQMLEEEVIKLWQQKMIKEAANLDVEASLVFLAITIILEEKAKDLREGEWIKRNELLKLLGKKPHPKHGYQYKDKMDLYTAIHALQHLHVRLYSAEWEDSVTLKNGGTITKRRSGPVPMQAELYFLNVSGTVDELLLWGKERAAWLVSVNKYFLPFIFPYGRQFGILSRKVFELHRQKEKYETRLAIYLALIWRIRAASGNLLQPFTMRTLHNQIKLGQYTKQPSKQIARMEKALDKLVEAGIVAAWQYRDGYRYEQPKRFEDWLNETVVIEPPEAHKELSARIARPEVKPKPKAALPPAAGAFDLAAIKSARLARNLTQLQAAEELQAVMDKHNMKRTLSRTLLAKWESGKKKPDDTMKKILLEWIAGAV